MPFGDSENPLIKPFADLLKRIFAGEKGLEIAQDYFDALADLYAQGASVAYGKEIANIDYTTPDAKLLEKIRENIFVFSGAKTYDQLKALSAELLDETGTVRSFHDFKQATATVYKNYNELWLKAEYNHATASATMAALWQEHQANSHLLPYLEYATVGDERVRAEHVALDGITLPIDNVFWNTNYPPNGWNCRCDVLAQDSSKTVTSQKVLDELKTQTPVKEMFRNNVGKDGIVFPEKHPYFDISKAERKAIDVIAQAKIKGIDANNT